MNPDKASPAEIFEHLYQVISNERFLEKKGIGNEVPFFICPFSPKQTTTMEDTRRRLVNKLGQSGIIVLDVNLYDTVIELLKERGRWERVLQVEPKSSKRELLELLRGLLDTEKHLIPAIARKMQTSGKFHTMFLSGIGEVFPYIRSHTLLNNLQSTATEHPTVLFFPGRYAQSSERGASLELFGRLHDDNYYRAFNILHYSV